MQPQCFDVPSAMHTIQSLNFTRECGSEGERRGFRVITRLLDEIGVSWHYHTFRDKQLDRSEREGEFRNLVAEIPGAANPAEVVVMGAHMDSWPGTVGASDDAAGCAVLVEAAKWFVQNSPARTVRLVWFTGEEVDSRGSRCYVSDCLPDPSAVKLMICVDSSCEIDAPGGFEAYAAAEQTYEWARQRLDIAEMPHDIVTTPGTDARAFIEAGIQIFAIEAPFKQSEHLPDDSPESIDPEKLRVLGQVSIEAAVHAANES